MCSIKQNKGFGSFKPLKKIVEPAGTLSKEIYVSKTGVKLTTVTVKGKGKIKFSK